MYTTSGVVTVHLNNQDNTLAGSDKFTSNAYNHSNKVANIIKA